MRKVKEYHKRYPTAPRAIAAIEREYAEEDGYFARQLAALQGEDDKLQVELLTRDAKLPFRATAESAGMDLCITEDLVLKPHDRKLAPTSLRMCTPPGTYGRIAPRSGLSLKGIDIGAGVIDRDFRGELKVLLINNSNQSFTFLKGDRIAQLILERISNAQITPVEWLDSTVRNEGGFGSTGI